MEFSKIRTNLHYKKLFLIDSLGALLSSVLLGLVLTRFEAIFGMSKSVLYVLSTIAFLFSVYSFFCFLYRTENWKMYMKGIAVANLMYGCLTIGMMVYFYQNITAIGLMYFMLELIVIGVLAIIELHTEC